MANTLTEAHKPGPTSLPMQLSGRVLPLSETTLVSQHLTFAYSIEEISIHFPEGCAHLVRIHPMICRDDSVSTSGLPPGTPVLAFLSPITYLTGDGITLTFRPNYIVATRGTWLKAHLENLDAFPHAPSILFTLRQIEVDQ